MAAGLLLAVAGCSSGDAGGDTAAPSSGGTSSAPATVEVSGTIKVDSVFSVKRVGADCSVSGDIAQYLKVGASPVVITDPDGTQVALGQITGTETPTYLDDDGNSQYAPGFCDLLFSATGVPSAAGIFTAAVPELQLEARFPATGSTGLVLKYDERG